MTHALKKTRCAACGQFAETLVEGRCPLCTRVLEAHRGDWRAIFVLVRGFRRHDGRSLDLELHQMPDDQPERRWALHAAEREKDDVEHVTLGTFGDMPSAIAAGELFGRRWLESAPGTSLATYVPRPAGG